MILANNITTTNTNITIGGNLDIADTQDVILQTGGGSLTISGTTIGDAGPGNETFTIDAGTGTVSVGDIFGAAATPANVSTGLTDVAITNSGAIHESTAITK